MSNLLRQKKWLAALLMAIVALFWLWGGENADDWTPTGSAKKKKSKGPAYEVLRKEVLQGTPTDSILPLPQNLPDPFKSVSSAHQGAGGAGQGIKRNYLLKGILLQKPPLAVILDPTGESHVAGKGDAFKGVTVLSVESDRVKLKDVYGVFTLEQK